MGCVKKYVYLFELDSVCKTDEDIILAQRVLYNEIAINGNIVVLSYNQVVDSRGFFSLWSDKKYNKGILELFEKGAIKISQVKDIRTVAQFLINSIQPEKEFIYSSFPVKYNQKRMTAMLRRCLENSDLSEIKDYIELANSDNLEDDKKVQDLFVEVIDGKECPPQIGKDKMRYVLKNLYSYVDMVLRLSMMPDIYISPRERKEYSNLKFCNILGYVLEFKNNNYPLFDKAVSILSGLEATKSNNNNRSVYYRDLTNVLSENNRTECYYARAILDIVYNYTCEISIANTSKHYISSELMDNVSDKKTFRGDFFKRLDYYWRDGVDSDARFQTGDDNDVVEFTRIKEIPNFEQAARMVGIQKKNFDIIPYVYEHNLKIERRIQCIQVIEKNIWNIAWAFICVSILCVFEKIADGIFTGDKMVLIDIVETMISLIFTELLSIGFAKIIGWRKLRKIISTILPNIYTRYIEDFRMYSFYEALGLMLNSFLDFFRAIFHKKYGYYNKSNKNIVKFERYNESHPTEYITPYELQKYSKWLDSTYNNILLTKDSKIVKIADISNDGLEKLIRQDELYGYNYGIAIEHCNKNVAISLAVHEGDKISPHISYILTYGIIVLLHYDSKYMVVKDKMRYRFPYGKYNIHKKEWENINKALNGICTYSYTNNNVKRVGTIINESRQECVHVVKIELAKPPIRTGKTIIAEYTIGELRRMIDSKSIVGDIDKAVCSMNL